MAKKKKKKSTGKAQKKQQKHALKRKQKRRRLARLTSKWLRPSLRAAANWPLHEVLISETWRDPKDLTQIFVVRSELPGVYAIGVFLVDQACLGVKNAFARIVDEAEYREMRRRLLETQDFISSDLNLAAKIIEASIEYARGCGIEPHPDFKPARIMLQGADPDACEEDIPLGGPEGKPLFIAGPYDNVQKIFGTLMRNLGPEGFHFIAPLTPPPTDDFFDDFDDGVWDEDAWDVTDDEAFD